MEQLNTFKFHMLDKETTGGLKVVTFNILADKYAYPDRYSYCQDEVITWKFRKELLSKMIDQLNADILCMQEVEEKSCKEVLETKSNYNVFHGDACSLAILVRKDIKLGKSFDVKNLNTWRWFLWITIELNGQEIMIGNAHLLGDPEKKKEQKIQAEKIIKTCLAKLEKQEMPILICGDFNTQPYSETYKVFTESKLFTSSQSQYLKESKSKYDEPPFTFFTNFCKLPMDYIWVTKEFQCIGALKIYEELTEPIPSKDYSSDHVPIGSLLLIKENKQIEKVEIQ